MEWIDCNERMPKEDQIVLLAIEYEEEPVVAESINSAFRACTKNFETNCMTYCYGGFPVGGFKQKAVTHWMEIPDTPYMQQQKKRGYE